MTIQKANNSSHVTIAAMNQGAIATGNRFIFIRCATHRPFLSIGGKEASPPKKSWGTAYRGTTGSTVNSISRDSTDCKENSG